MMLTVPYYRVAVKITAYLQAKDFMSENPQLSATKYAR